MCDPVLKLRSFFILLLDMAVSSYLQAMFIDMAVRHFQMLDFAVRLQVLL